MDFQRWYDRDVNLGELVRTLEGMGRESQTLFAFLIADFSERIMDAQGRDFFVPLGWDTVRNLLRSRQGRRWYDEEPAMQQAFGKLYSLKPEERAVIGRELHVPARLVSRYETACRNRGEAPDLEKISEIVDTCFGKGPAFAQEFYKHLDTD